MSECWECKGLKLQSSISNSAARQLFVYKKNTSRKYYVKHNTMAWVNAKLGHAFNCIQSEVSKT